MGPSRGREPGSQRTSEVNTHMGELFSKEVKEKRPLDSYSHPSTLESVWLAEMRTLVELSSKSAQEAIPCTILSYSSKLSEATKDM